MKNSRTFSQLTCEDKNQPNERKRDKQLKGLTFAAASGMYSQYNRGGPQNFAPPSYNQGFPQGNAFAPVMNTFGGGDEEFEEYYTYSIDEFETDVTDVDVVDMTAFMPSRPGKYHNSPLRNNSIGPGPNAYGPYGPRTAMMPQRAQQIQGRAPGMSPGMSPRRAARPNPRRLNSRQDFGGWVMQKLSDPLNCVFTVMMIVIGCFIFNKMFKNPDGTAIKNPNGTGFFSNPLSESSSVIDNDTLQKVHDTQTNQHKMMPDGKLVYWDPNTATEVYLTAPLAKTDQVDWTWRVFGGLSASVFLAEIAGYCSSNNWMRASHWLGPSQSEPSSSPIGKDAEEMEKLREEQKNTQEELNTCKNTLDDCAKLNDTCAK